MKAKLLLISLPFFLLGCNKKDESKNKFVNCKDSLLAIKPKNYERLTSKIFLDYKFGMTKREYNQTSYILRNNKKIDENNYYVFDYPALNGIKFMISESYHNDSIRSLSIFNSPKNRIGKDKKVLFKSLNTILINKYKTPICSCNSNKLWLSDGKIIESSLEEDDKYEYLSLEIKDYIFQRYLLNFSHSINYRMSKDYDYISYDKWYEDKYLNPSINKRRKAELNKGAKDL